MSIMLENQAKQLVVEANTTGTGATFTPGTGEQYAAVALPLVRKVFGQIAAKGIRFCSANVFTCWFSILPRLPVRNN